MTGTSESFAGPEYWSSSLFAHNWPKGAANQGYASEGGREWAIRVRNWCWAIRDAQDIEQLEWTANEIRDQYDEIHRDVLTELFRRYDERKQEMLA